MTIDAVVVADGEVGAVDREEEAEEGRAAAALVTGAIGQRNAGAADLAAGAGGTAAGTGVVAAAAGVSVAAAAEMIFVATSRTSSPAVICGRSAGTTSS